MANIYGAYSKFFDYFMEAKITIDLFNSQTEWNTFNFGGGGRRRRKNALKLVGHESLLNIKKTKLAYKKDQIKNRKQTWQGKAQHGQYISKIKNSPKADNKT